MDQKKQLSDEVIVEKSRSDPKEHPSLKHGSSTNTTTFAIVAIDCILEHPIAPYQRLVPDRNNSIGIMRIASWVAPVVALSPER